MRYLKFYIVAILLIQLQFVFAQTEIEKEIKLGDEYAKMVEAEMGIWDNPGMQAYINSVGQRLVSKLDKQPYPYTFQIVDQWEPNAFSIPGGHVYISRGLIILFNNESELAGVLGHEIGHIIEHHSLKIQKRQKRASILAIPAVVIGTLTQNKNIENLLMLPALGIGKAYLSTYGRGQEHDADKVGQEIAVKAGYDVNGLPSILLRLEEDITYLNKGKTHNFSIFDDHPMTPDRVERLNKTSSKYATCARTADLKAGNDFTKTWNGLLYGPNANEGAFVNNEFIHPQLKLKMLFPTEWVYVNEKEAVGALTKDQKNLIVLTFAAKGNKADSLQTNAIAKLKQKSLTPESTNSTTINGYHVTQVRYSETDDKGVKTSIWASWIEKDEYTYVLIGQSFKDIEQEYTSTLKSIHSTTSEDISRIKVTVVRINNVQASDNFENLNKRTGNVWEEKLFYIVNGVAQFSELKPEVDVKVLVEENYK